MSAADCTPAEAAFQAAQWRKAAQEPDIPPGVIKARLDLAAEYQALVQCGDVDDGHTASEAVEE